MKKALLLLLICILLTQSGCDSTGSIYSNFREISQIQIIVTAGVDRYGEGVGLTISSGRSPEGGQRTLMSRRGASVDAALESLQNYSASKELFYSHMHHILLGEDSAKSGISPLLDYIERTPNIRMGVELFVVRGGTAKDLMTGSGDESYDISEVMSALERDIEFRGTSHAFTVRDTARALAERGACLISAVTAAPTEGVVHSLGDEVITAVPSGFGILRKDSLVAYLDTPESMAVCILIDPASHTEFTLPDGSGGLATVILNSAQSSFTPIYKQNVLERIDLHVSVGTSLMELSRPDNFSDDSYLRQIEDVLANYLMENLASVLGKTNETHCDFLGLGNMLREYDSSRFDAMAPAWEDMPGQLAFHIEVQATVNRTLDLNDSVEDEGSEISFDSGK